MESRSFPSMFKSQNVSRIFRITTTSFYADRHAHNRDRRDGGFRDFAVGIRRDGPDDPDIAEQLPECMIFR